MQKIIILKKNLYSYPSAVENFRPDTPYPEYFFKEDLSRNKNEVYDMVRETLYLAGYDIENYGTNKWNPLKNIVFPGNTVLIKPNMVMDENPVGDINCLYTHPSVVAPIIDYVILATNGKGKIVVGDAPVQECNFEKLVMQSGYTELIEYYLKKGIEIKLIDFRELHSVVKGGVHYNSILSEARGTVIDLKDQSEFCNKKKKELEKLRITNYNPEILKRHHQEGKHEYYVSDYMLEADVIINIPKPKTHRKAGVTISLKNMVGINVRKEYLPHHTIGSKESGGDEYLKKNYWKEQSARLYDILNYKSAQGKYNQARMFKSINKICSLIAKIVGKDPYREGSWYGNETISKTIIDLNKILMYADKEGHLCLDAQRRELIIADMIISGEKEGPLRPSPKQIGIIALGENPVCFDEVIAAIMGANIKKIPTLVQARMSQSDLKIVGADEKGEIISNIKKWDKKKAEDISEKEMLHFIPTSGWKNAFVYGDKL